MCTLHISYISNICQIRTHQMHTHHTHVHVCIWTHSHCATTVPANDSHCFYHFNSNTPQCIHTHSHCTTTGVANDSHCFYHFNSNTPQCTHMNTGLSYLNSSSPKSPGLQSSSALETLPIQWNVNRYSKLNMNAPWKVKGLCSHLHDKLWTTSAYFTSRHSTCIETCITNIKLTNCHA